MAHACITSIDFNPNMHSNPKDDFVIPIEFGTVLTIKYAES